MKQHISTFGIMQVKTNIESFSKQFIWLNFTLLFIVLLILPNISISQNNSFVYLKNGKFMLDSSEYFPLTLNYAVDIVKDINGNFYISPHAQYCKWVKCDKGSSGFYCGTNTKEWKSTIRSHIDKIADMGFNSIRLCGLGLNYNPDKHGSGVLVSKVYHEQHDPDNLKCFKREKRIKIKRKTINIQIDLFEAFVQIVREHNLALPDKQLKVILTTGTGGLQYVSWKYTKFLSVLGDRFKNDPTVFAYEPNFEAYYLGYPKHEINQKYERAEDFAQWYYALKEAAPSQLVTYGASLRDVFNWDAKNFPMDFINLHLYTSNNQEYNSREFERYKCRLKWFSEVYDKPWIIGETGIGGNDVANRQNSLVPTEEQQKEFASSSLAYARWYGGIGYAWWQYKEVKWFSITNPKARSNYLGLVRMKDRNEAHKVAVESFIKFDPFVNCYTCFDPDPEIYYNPNAYEFLNLKGRIVTKEGKPVKNAFISCKSKNENYFTFSDENGEFNLHTQPNDHIFSLIASYPGMTVIQLGKWNGPKLDPELNLTIDFLDKDLLPLQPEN